MTAISPVAQLISFRQAGQHLLGTVLAGGVAEGPLARGRRGDQEPPAVVRIRLAGDHAHALEPVHRLADRLLLDVRGARKLALRHGMGVDQGQYPEAGMREVVGPQLQGDVVLDQAARSDEQPAQRPLLLVHGPRLAAGSFVC
ncbi:MAG: hypothetical protein V9G10_05350 [Candidatus Nanopelagicales bacterium]